MAAEHTRHNGRSHSSSPDGWMPAGYAAPLRLTVKQERYCRRAIGTARFIYNLCAATHRFCRTNRMAWAAWQDLYKAFNAAKREDYPFATEVASRVQEGAFMDFGAALRNWRDPSHQAGPPRFRKKRRTGADSFRAASGVATLRDGKALAAAAGCRETDPDDRRTAPPETHPGNADCVMTNRPDLNVNTP